MPTFVRAILIQESAKGGLSYKAKKGLSNDSPWSLYYHKLNEKSE